MDLTRLLSLLFLFSSAVGHAQFGIGLTPGSMCNNAFAPGRGAINGADEFENLRGQLNVRKARIRQAEEKIKAMNTQIRRAEDEMGTVLTKRGLDELVVHREHNSSRDSYRLNCPQSTAFDGRSTDSGLLNSSSHGNVPEVGGTIPPPDIFCQSNSRGQVANLWDRFADDRGKMNKALCDYCIAGVTRSRECTENRARERCREGMDRYYKLMKEKDELVADMRKYKEESEEIRDRLADVREEVTDGTYCADCNAKRRGYSNLGTGDSVWQTAAVLGIIGLGLVMNSGQRQGPPPPGPGYPRNPYPARVPGYYGMAGPAPGQMMYGGVPGAIGAGGFGCQGANPLDYGNPGALSIFGGPSPLNNPYMSLMRPWFNQGAGPGWGFPQYGNGVSAFADPWAMTGASPYYQPGMVDPLLYNAYNPWGTVFAAPANPGLYGPGYPYRGSPSPTFAPTWMPYIGSNPMGGGAAGVVAGPGYGAWGNGGGWNSSVYNYSSQMNLLNSRIYGGGGGAPVVLPAQGGAGFGVGGGAGFGAQPIFSQPVGGGGGTRANPAPMILPVNR